MSETKDEQAAKQAYHDQNIKKKRDSDNSSGGHGGEGKSSWYKKKYKKIATEVVMITLVAIAEEAMQNKEEPSPLA